MWKKKLNSLNTIIGKDTEFYGSISNYETVRVEGKIKADNMTSTFGDLIVNKTGKVVSDLKVSNITIAGEVWGDINCKGKLELLSQGKLIGNIKVSKLYIEKGAVFEGKCTMLADSERKSKRSHDEFENQQFESQELINQESKEKELVNSLVKSNDKKTERSQDGLKEPGKEDIKNINDEEKLDGEKSKDVKKIGSYNNISINNIYNPYNKLYFFKEIEELLRGKDLKTDIKKEKNHTEIQREKEDKEEKQRSKKENQQNEGEKTTFKVSPRDFIHKLDKTGRINLAQFYFNSNYKIKKCPAEVKPNKSLYKPKKEVSISYFDSSYCKNCPLFDICRVNFFSEEEMILKATKKSLLTASKEKSL